MDDIFDIEALLPELVIALGLAMLIGNGLAWWKHRRGDVPDEVESAAYRPARVAFFVIVGVVMTAWGAASLFG